MGAVYFRPLARFTSKVPVAQAFSGCPRFPRGAGGAAPPPSNILKGKQVYKEITFAAEGGKQTFLGKLTKKITV